MKKRSVNPFVIIIGIILGIALAVLVSILLPDTIPPALHRIIMFLALSIGYFVITLVVSRISRK